MQQQSKGNAVHPDLPFSVDTWDSHSCDRPQFLTHAHKDHALDIVSFARTIHCTEITKEIILIRYPALSLNEVDFEILELNETLEVKYGRTRFTVTAYDAHHCPGAASLLFQGDFGTVLHSGDCRWQQRIDNILPQHIFQPGSVDLLYLDCTFGDVPQDFPSPLDAIKQVLNLIQQNEDAPKIFLAFDGLGTEHILRHVCRSFKTKVHLQPEGNSFGFLSNQLQRERFEELALLLGEENITTDPTASRFSICGGQLLAAAAAEKLTDFRRGGQKDPIFIRASTQRWAREATDRAEQLSKPQRAATGAIAAPKEPCQERGIWNVLYSMHSSRGELLRAVRDLRPRAVVPIAGGMDSAFRGLALETPQDVERMFEEAAALRAAMTPTPSKADTFISPLREPPSTGVRSRRARTPFREGLDSPEEAAGPGSNGSGGNRAFARAAAAPAQPRPSCEPPPRECAGNPPGTDVAAVPTAVAVPPAAAGVDRTEARSPPAAPAPAKPAAAAALAAARAPSPSPRLRKRPVPDSPAAAAAARSPPATRARGNGSLAEPTAAREALRGWVSPAKNSPRALTAWPTPAAPAEGLSREGMSRKATGFSGGKLEGLSRPEFSETFSVRPSRPVGFKTAGGVGVASLFESTSRVDIDSSEAESGCWEPAFKQAQNSPGRLMQVAQAHGGYIPVKLSKLFTIDYDLLPP